MSWSGSRLAAVTGLAALTIFSAAAGAGAASLAGSHDVADDSVRSIDIRDGNLSGQDFKRGSLAGPKFAGGLPVRKPGPDRVLTWTGSYQTGTNTGGDGPLLISADSVPANSLVRGLDLELSGDHSMCSGFSVTVKPEGLTANDNFVVGQAFLGPDSLGNTSHDRFTDEVLTRADAPTHLEILGGCDQSGTSIAVPSFDFTVTFSITELINPPTTAFH